MAHSDPIERITPGDLVELLTDVGPVPMNVGALLWLEQTGTDPLEAPTVRDVLVTRLGAVPRLRRHLVRPAPGLGRPYWGGDDDADGRVGIADCPPGERALLDLAAAEVSRPLDRSGPPWRATVVRQGASVAVVVVLHHVLADGIGGLAVLAEIADAPDAPERGSAGLTRPSPSGASPFGASPSGASPSGAPRTRPLPTRRALLADAWRERVARWRLLPQRWAHLHRGRAELAGSGPGAPRTSLNRPTGPRRTVHLVDVELVGLRSATRWAGATINDALLVATTAGMADVLRRRGEQAAALVVSVPVAARAATTTADLGNQVGVMPVRVGLDGALGERLVRVAAETRARKAAVRGASAALIGPVFRALARVGLFRWFVDRQRLVNSFLTNLPGPPVELGLAGARISRMVPITVTAGNVGVAFAALSYAGRLGVTVITDPEVVPEAAELAAAVGRALATLAAPAGRP